MSLFDGGPLGPWPHDFSNLSDLGCGGTFVGFILFLVVLAVLWWTFFG